VTNFLGELRIIPAKWHTLNAGFTGEKSREDPATRRGKGTVRTS
jgi:hypothetical protein